MHKSYLQENEAPHKANKYISRLTQAIIFTIMFIPINNSFAKSTKSSEAEFVLNKINVTSRPTRMNNQEGIVVIENIVDNPLNVEVTFSEEKLRSSNTIVASCSSIIAPHKKEEFGLLQCGNNFKQNQIIKIVIENNSFELYSTMLDGEPILVKNWSKKKGVQIINYLYDKLK